MINKYLKKSIAMLLIISMTIITPFSTFAAGLNNGINNFNKYGILNANDVSVDIQKSTDFEVVEFPGEQVTYYYGDNYTIVKDSKGYSKIDFMENGRILVNGKEVESRIKNNKVEKSMINPLSVSPLAAEEWVPYGSASYMEYNVIGLAPSILGGIFGAGIGYLIGSKAGTVFSIVGGSIAGLLGGTYFPEYYVSVISQDYYQSPVVTQRPITKTVYEVYHGPKYNRYDKYWFTHATR